MYDAKPATLAFDMQFSLIITDRQHQLCSVTSDFYNDDVIMGAMGSQITSLTIVYSTVYSDADQRKHQTPRHWHFCGEFTGDRWIPRTNGQ